MTPLRMVLFVAATIGVLWLAALWIPPAIMETRP